ncbi:hypothetical protein COO91_05633 [Nostoc flagelliforme CCNUN1]|uniref:Uncharacterized protein n=1 Tax=Nostoc flagelliforme CCNUN1 TaxID=2038116 RepID=A0A2K8SY03_9NOSO|nr:hypothetical protein COO91_05633 [Nostoc flagelliforme CCNUN1]
MLLRQKGDFSNWILKKAEKADLVRTPLALTQQYLLYILLEF